MPIGIYKHKLHSEGTKRKMSQMRKGYHPVSEFKKGKEHHCWQGGKKKELGYISIYCPNHPSNNRNYVREHRLIIEKQIGRYLHRWEVSHHINKIKIDNRPKNLMAFKSHSLHKKFEKGKSIKSSDIVFDGRKLNS